VVAAFDEDGTPLRFPCFEDDAPLHTGARVPMPLMFSVRAAAPF
jgi:hypothetical protein